MFPTFETLENRNCPSTITQDGTWLVFRDDSDVNNNLSITQVESQGMTKFRFVDTSGDPIELPPGPPQGWQLTEDGAAEISTAGFLQIQVWAGDADDVVDARTLAITLWLFGNEGNDTLYGGSGDDYVLGGDT